MKPKGIKKAVSYYNRMYNDHILEIYYRPRKNQIFSEEFVGEGRINFSEDDDEVVVIGFYKKGRDKLTMEILRQDLEEKINRMYTISHS